MNKRETILLNNAHAELFTFDNGNAVKEFHVMLHVSTPSLTWAEQIDAIENAYTQLRKDVLTESTPVIKRYFLSDAANQANDIYSRTTEGAECAISIIEQPPLDGTKIAMWVYLMTDVETRTTDSGLYEVKHGIYRHLWNASAHNLAANSEFQTRLLLNE